MGIFTCARCHRIKKHFSRRYQSNATAGNTVTYISKFPKENIFTEFFFLRMISITLLPRYRIFWQFEIQDLNASLVNSCAWYDIIS